MFIKRENKVKNKKTITVYWSPATFDTTETSWDSLYPEPSFILPGFHKSSGPKNSMASCPAIKKTLRNVLCFNSAIDDVFDLPNHFMSQVAFTDTDNQLIPVDSKLYFRKIRKSSMPNYINVGYNLSWVMFADEPVEVKFTAPYFPSVSPVEKAFFSTGQFDIGKWFRPFTLDYHIPLKSKEFRIEANQPLFFAEFLTEKKIVVKRFQLTPRLKHIMDESTFAPLRYGQNLTLAQRYKMAHNAKIPKMVLQEIQKSLLD